VRINSRETQQVYNTELVGIEQYVGLFAENSVAFAMGTVPLHKIYLVGIEHCVGLFAQISAAN